MEGLGSFLIFLVTSAVDETASGLLLGSTGLVDDLPFLELLLAGEFFTIVRSTQMRFEYKGKGAILFFN